MSLDGGDHCLCDAEPDTDAEEEEEAEEVSADWVFGCPSGTSTEAVQAALGSSADVVTLDSRSWANCQVVAYELSQLQTTEYNSCSLCSCPAIYLQLPYLQQLPILCRTRSLLCCMTADSYQLKIEPMCVQVAATSLARALGTAAAPSPNEQPHQTLLQLVNTLCVEEGKLVLVHVAPGLRQTIKIVCVLVSVVLALGFGALLLCHEPADRSSCVRVCCIALSAQHT